MADKRITQLNPLSNPAGEDLFAVVDVDAQETKKTTFDELVNTLQLNRSVVYGLFNQTGSLNAISASTDELSIINGGVGTLTVPANSFQVGDAYQVVSEGTCKFTNNDTFRIKIKTDSTILADTGNITVGGATDKRWKLDINFSIHNTGSTGEAIIVSAGTFTYTKDAATTFEGVHFGTENSSSFDTTIDNTLEVTGQFSSTNNAFTSRIFTLHKIF
jgi:hypothetical protein